MKLRYKLFSILIISAFLFSGSIFWLFSARLNLGFEKIETDAAVDSVDRVVDEIKNLETQLLVKQSDWASWDDTYQFMQDRNAEYAESNLQPQALANLKVELMFFVNTDKKIIHSYAVDIVNKKEIKPTQGMLNLANPSSQLFHAHNEEGRRSGLVLLEKGPFVVAAQPILTTDGKGPSRGTLSWGFYLNQQVVDHLNDLVHLKFDLLTSGSSNEVGTEAQIERQNEDLLVGSIRLKDIDDKPQFLVRVYKDRPIYQQGRVAIRTVGWVQLALAVSFLIVLYILLQKFILSRFVMIDASLNQIAASSDYSGMVPNHFRDEFGNLSTNINQVLELLRKKMAREIEANHKIAKHELQLRMLVNHALDAIVAVTESGEIIDWNPEAERIFQWKRDNVVGKNIIDVLVPTKNREEFVLEMQQLAKSGSDADARIRREVRLMNADGTDFPTELSVVAVRLENHCVFNWFMRDLRQKEALEKQAKEIQAQFIEAQKFDAIGKLAGGIAHEFNNILNGILGHAVLMREKANPALQSHLDTIIASCDRGGTLTKGMLGFSRKGQYEKKVFSLNDSIREAMNLLIPTFGKKIHVHMEFASQLWFICADSTQVVQMIVNLAVNSRDAMPNGGDIIIVTSNVVLVENDSPIELARGRYVRMSFSDTGLGIAHSIREKIFDPFFTTKDAGKGSGLGLAMIAGVVQSHGGRILLDEDYTNGACFHLYFPAVDEQQLKHNSEPTGVSLQTHEKKNASGITLKSFKGKTVLVVDDEPVALTYLKEIFEMSGLTVVIAQNGQEALSTITEKKVEFDFGVFDVLMPNMTGFELYARVRDFGNRMPIVFASGYAEDTESARIQANDESVVLVQKPVNPKDLAMAISKVVRMV